MTWSLTNSPACDALNSTVQNLDRAVLYIDADGHIMGWNALFLELFEVQSSALEMKPHWSKFGLLASDLLGIEDLPHHLQVRVEISVCERPVELFLIPQDDGGLVCIYTPFTDLLHEIALLRQQREKLENEVRSLQGALDDLARESLTDRLTGAWNRRYFEQMIGVELSRTQRFGQRLCILLFDIDHFKKINDTLGHGIGDQVLIHLSTIVRASLRETDVLIRWGGEEFLVLAPATDKYNGVIVAEKLRQTVASYDFPGINKVTISIGISEYIYGEEVDHCVERADQALYAAKHGGRNRSKLDQQMLKIATDGQIQDLDWLLLDPDGTQIEQEHLELAREIDKLIVCHNRNLPLADQITPMDNLIRMTGEHFASEEQLQDQSKFPRAKWHQDVHKHLLLTAENLYTQILEGKIGLVPMIDFFVSQIVVGHFHKMDEPFEKWLSEQAPRI